MEAKTAMLEKKIEQQKILLLRMEQQIKKKYLEFLRIFSSTASYREI